VGKILIPYIKEEYIKAPASNKKQYANDLGGLSFHAILQKEYVEAEAAAKEAIAADETQHWIYTNLAASLLLQGKVAEAETIYTQWKTEFKWAFLNDFRLFEDMNILTDEQKKDVEMIKNKLRE
jgi:tetratricopeptide (TPR) repeat protein